MKLDALLERVRQVYADRPDLKQLIDESVIDTLGLTMLEVKVLAALLVAEGSVLGVATDYLPELRAEVLGATIDSLVARQLVERGENNIVDFSPAMRQLKMQTPEELEEQGPEDEPPSVKMVLRPVREQVLWLARSADTQVRGLARVYAYLYGGTYSSRTFGLLGLYVRELGLEKAALFLLEHTHEQRQDPLTELLPFARAQAKGFRPADAPAKEAVNKGRSDMHLVALEKRVQRYGEMNSAGEDPEAAYGQQYWEDLKLWTRLGRPELVWK